MITGVTFNSFDLSTITGISLTERIITPAPDTVVQSLKLARRQGNKLVNAEFGSRKILVNGFIAAASWDAMMTARDTLESKLYYKEAALVVPASAGTNRQFTATKSNIIYADVDGGFCTFSIEFLCSYPFGFDTAATTALGSTTITTATSSPAITFGGSYQAVPLIQVTVTSLTGGTAQPIKITNPATGQYIQVTRNWAAADVLQIDVLNKVVTVNGVKVDYAGTFPEWDVATGSIRYDDGFTTRSVSLLVTYVKRFI